MLCRAYVRWGGGGILSVVRVPFEGVSESWYQLISLCSIFAISSYSRPPLKYHEYGQDYLAEGGQYQTLLIHVILQRGGGMQ